MDKCIVYIGDFDLRNENVQAHLVKNNGKIFNALGYYTVYIGINRNETAFQGVADLPPYSIDGGEYLELPNTLSTKGLLQVGKICNAILDKLNAVKKDHLISHVITYQSPTYAVAIKKIACWAKENGVKYIVNCADLPIFDLQSPIKRLVMQHNWAYLHKLNHQYADGIIAVSKYIADFYHKEGRASVVLPPLFDSVDAKGEFPLNEKATFVYAGTPFKLTGRAADPAGMKDRLDKVIDLFLGLSQENAQYVFNIIGIEKEDYLAGVPRHRAALAQEDKIRFLGRRSHDETLAMVAAADYTINYRDENLMTKAGFSTKIVESVSLGTPVVINNISDTFTYLQDGRDGIMLSGDLHSDMEMLKNACILSPQARQQCKQNLFERKLFDIWKYKDSMDSFLHS